MTDKNQKEENDASFKVKDRRQFNSEGEERESEASSKPDTDSQDKGQAKK